MAKKYVIRRYLESCDGPGIVVAEYDTYSEAMNHLRRLERARDRKSAWQVSYNLSNEPYPVQPGYQYTIDQNGNRVYH